MNKNRVIKIQTQTSLDIACEFVKCRRRPILRELEYLGDRVKCPKRGYRILRKTRPIVGKRVKAS